ncbi:hypothetical protein COO60DRAFT_849593 [Scenedesmus sp. NREL 46B-D3]|nr:hypothetical protein COO60DRAFT_849593 [Scenedesmus sp. NREL 46B-D3]
MQHVGALESANVQTPGRLLLRAYFASQLVHPWPNSPVQQQCQPARHPRNSCSHSFLNQSEATAGCKGLSSLQQQACRQSSSTGCIAGLQPPAGSLILQNRPRSSMVCRAVSSSSSSSSSSASIMSGAQKKIMLQQQPPEEDGGAPVGASTVAGAGRLSLLLQTRSRSSSSRSSSSGRSSNMVMPSDADTSTTSGSNTHPASYGRAASADAGQLHWHARKLSGSGEGSSTEVASQQQQLPSNHGTAAQLQLQQQLPPSQEPSLQQLPQLRLQQQQHSSSSSPSRQCLTLPSSPSWTVCACCATASQHASSHAATKPVQPATPLVLLPSSSSSSSGAAAAAAALSAANAAPATATVAMASAPVSCSCRWPQPAMRPASTEQQATSSCNMWSAGGCLLTRSPCRTSWPATSAWQRSTGTRCAGVAARAPPIIRSADEVPSRLQQLSQLMGGADMQQVLALSRRCPMALGVEAALMAPRLESLCKLLQKPVEARAASSCKQHLPCSPCIPARWRSKCSGWSCSHNATLGGQRRTRAARARAVQCCSRTASNGRCGLCSWPSRGCRRSGTGMARWASPACRPSWRGVRRRCSSCTRSTGLGTTRMLQRRWRQRKQRELQQPRVAGGRIRMLVVWMRKGALPVQRCHRRLLLLEQLLSQ